ncbi:Integral membrane protein 2A [Bagarius yarrelli]|uniref:Integral membrane protein 2 n=1 Tax=Bagarius yarrelli TaxID=175774 RepID=A0A556U1U0_BAGYA|nr:Integral membrane protein 2A [Bagarius yarrelli]
MVKIAFNSALAQKAHVKVVPVSEKDPETGSVYSSDGSTGRCLLTLLGLAFILSGLIVGGACLYRYLTPKKLYHGSMQFTDIDSADIPIDIETHAPYYLPRVDEDVEIQDNMAIINVPAPRFGAGDPAYILHDFKRSGSYKSYLVHEDLVVTERIDDLAPLGSYINNLCKDRPTYRMQRRNEILGLQKRSVEDCHIIRHFENTFVTETKICLA